MEMVARARISRVNARNSRRMLSLALARAAASVVVRKVGRTRSNASETRGPGQCVVHEKDHDGADARNRQTTEIEAGYPSRSEGVEEPAADDRSDDSKKNVHHDTLSPPIDDLAGYEARNQPKDHPRDN